MATVQRRGRSVSLRFPAPKLVSIDCLSPRISFPFVSRARYFGDVLVDVPAFIDTIVSARKVIRFDRVPLNTHHAQSDNLIAFSDEGKSSMRALS